MIEKFEFLESEENGKIAVKAIVTVIRFVPETVTEKVFNHAEKCGCGYCDSCRLHRAYRKHKGLNEVDPGNNPQEGDKGDPVLPETKEEIKGPSEPGQCGCP